jgi:hypothetical protein
MTDSTLFLRKPRQRHLSVDKIDGRSISDGRLRQRVLLVADPLPRCGDAHRRTVALNEAIHIHMVAVSGRPLIPSWGARTAMVILLTLAGDGRRVPLSSVEPSPGDV